MTDKRSLKDMSPANLRDLYDVTDADLERIRALLPVIDHNMERFITEFYTSVNCMQRLVPPW